MAIYIAFSLQKLYYVQESHGIVVTDLAFLPDTLKGKNIKGTNETAMLSVAGQPLSSPCCQQTKILSYLAGAVLLWAHGGGRSPPSAVPLSRIYLNHASVVACQS